MEQLLVVQRTRTQLPAQRRFGGVVTSSTEALLDRFGVSKRSAEARDNGGALLPGQGRVDAKTYYQMIGTGGYETSGYYVYSATNIRLQELTLSYTMPNRWFGNVLKDVTVSFIANNPWMLYCEAPFDPRTDSLYRHLRTRQRLLYAAKCA